MKKELNVLCYVRSRIAKAPITAPMLFPNMHSAVKGFVEFCKKDDINPKENQLVQIALLDEDYSIKDDFNGALIKICNGDEAEEMYKQILDNLNAEDEFDNE